MGACPGNEESAGVSNSHRCPKGNRQMRRVLNQAANAAVKAKGWKILHEGVRYEERGPAVSVEAKKVRTRKMIRELRTLGYRVELLQAPSTSGMIGSDFRPCLIRAA
jgi:hypothetical protein